MLLLREGQEILKSCLPKIEYGSSLDGAVKFMVDGSPPHSTPGSVPDNLNTFRIQSVST